jgi:DNA recombination protein RmuC
MVSPSTLLATLKTVHTMWRNDKQNRFAVEIAEEAGKMYDKFVGFYEDMEKLGKQLHTVQGTYMDTMKKLHSGSGNLITRAEHIKSLGAKANKALPKSSLQDE